jgi:hypothetical protein
VAHVSFWLVPAEPYRADFQGLIQGLAEAYQATAFLPHVTLYSGPMPEGVNLEQVLGNVVRGIPRFTLEAVGVQQSSVFAKTVFVQLRPSDWLLRLARQIREALPDAAGYDLNPHLSLLYQALDPQRRQGIVDQVALPHTRIDFDQVQAVAAPDSFQTQADVQQLRCLYRHALGFNSQ